MGFRVVTFSFVGIPLLLTGSWVGVFGVMALLHVLFLVSDPF
jgi:hypothetical protein